MQRLRDETRADHDRVEGVVPIMREDLDVAAYRQILARFYGYHTPLEARLEALASRLPEALDWAARRKCPHLLADLTALGMDAEALAHLPRCERLPLLTNPARVLGCLYVLEGASLGGQVICRHLAERGPEIARNRRFFRGYGERTGRRWQEFRALLVENAPTRGEQDAVIEGARETFHTFTLWMSEGSIVDEC